MARLVANSPIVNTNQAATTGQRWRALHVATRTVSGRPDVAGAGSGCHGLDSSAHDARSLLEPGPARSSVASGVAISRGDGAECSPDVIDLDPSGAAPAPTNRVTGSFGWGYPQHRPVHGGRAALPRATAGGAGGPADGGPADGAKPVRTMVIGGIGPDLVVMKADDGSVLFTTHTGPETYGAPSAAEGMLFVGSMDGTLRAFGLPATP